MIGLVEVLHIMYKNPKANKRKRRRVKKKKKKNFHNNNNIIIIYNQRIERINR